jgi:hypothetical protein
MDGVKGTRLEGWLLATPSPRITPKSAFLRKLEKSQAPAVPAPKGNVTPLKRSKREA